MGDHCYFWSTDKKTWNEAEVFCQQNNGHLASITTPAINQYVLEGINSRGFTSSWVGGNDIYKEGFWKWSDSRPVFFTFWHSIEPNGGSSENCIHYKSWNDQMKLNDAPCSLSFTFICRKISGEIKFLPYFDSAYSKISFVYGKVSVVGANFSHDVTKDLTGHRMHVEGPQISEMDR